MQSMTVGAAGPDDAVEIDALLNTAPHGHVHPGWRTPAEWIGHAVALAARSSFGLSGVLIAPADPPPASWVRAAAVGSGFPTIAVMTKLFIACMPQLASQGATTLSALPTEPWLSPILDDLGFSVVEEVETWVKRDVHPVPRGRSTILIREARVNDMPVLESIERAAFEPRWRHSADTLSLVREQVSLFTVAEAAGQTVGFQFSLSEGERGHLVRLSVRPDAQHQGVGTQLLADAITQYARAGLTHVTLNTQNDNAASRRLYASFGFRPVGAPLPVWERPI